MSIAKIKSCLKKTKEEDIDSFWLEQVIVDLLFAVAEHLVESEPKKARDGSIAQGVPDGWVRLNDFIKEEKIFSTSTVSSLMCRNPEFKEKCVFKLGGKVYVDPVATKEHLLNIPRIKKMLARFGH